ncbi:hypothetical protein CBL_03639 [Carabus blaptoides fortunei]
MSNAEKLEKQRASVVLIDNARCRGTLPSSNWRTTSPDRTQSILLSQIFGSNFESVHLELVNQVMQHIDCSVYGICPSNSLYYGPGVCSNYVHQVITTPRAQLTLSAIFPSGTEPVSRGGHVDDDGVLPATMLTDVERGSQADYCGYHTRTVLNAGRDRTAICAVRFLQRPPPHHRSTTLSTSRTTATPPGRMDARLAGVAIKILSRAANVPHE